MLFERSLLKKLSKVRELCSSARELPFILYMPISGGIKGSRTPDSKIGNSPAAPADPTLSARLH